MLYKFPASRWGSHNTPNGLAAAVGVCLVLLSARSAVAGVTMTTEVEATGASVIEKEQVTQARERAIHDALRRAVESGVGTFVDSETLVKNATLIKDRIYTKANGFVERYDVTAEKKDGDMYHVTITARVRRAPLMAELVDLLTLDQQMGLPKIMVLMRDEKGGYGDPQRSARTIFVQKFTEKRFRLLNPEVAEKLQEDRETLRIRSETTSRNS